MKTTSSPNAELLSELRTAIQCRALLDVVLNDFGGGACDEREEQLLQLAIDLARRISGASLNTPAGCGAAQVCLLSNQLRAVLEVQPAIHASAISEPDEEVRWQLVDRIGYLQSAALNIAEGLVAELEALKTNEQAIAA